MSEDVDNQTEEPAEAEGPRGGEPSAGAPKETFLGHAEPRLTGTVMPPTIAAFVKSRGS